MNNEVIQGFRIVDKSCYKQFSELYRGLRTSEFCYSITHMLDSKIYYKFVDDVLVFIRPANIMGNIALIMYSTPVYNTGNEESDNIRIKAVIEEFLALGVKVKMPYRNYKKIHLTDYSIIDDIFGEEFIYDTEVFLKMDGGLFKRHRSEIRRFENNGLFNVSPGAYDYQKICENWSLSDNNSKHQKRLYKTISTNNLVNTILSFEALYYDKKPFGFSITETINETSGIIIQRLINPVENTSDVTELNYILHYMDCLRNRNKIMNIGGCGGIKNMEIAKEKLRPVMKQRMVRVLPEVKLNKDTFETFKETIK